jgi:hypothetical protein
MAERQLPKLHTRVRFPSPAQLIINDLRGNCTKTAPKQKSFRVEKYFQILPVVTVFFPRRGPF